MFILQTYRFRCINQNKPLNRVIVYGYIKFDSL